MDLTMTAKSKHLDLMASGLRQVLRNSRRLTKSGVVVEKLLSVNFTKMKSRQDAL
jgi:hypothetical protein